MSGYTYPTGILRNMKTGRFHPISFRLAPFPGLADINNDVRRYRSLGHHTDGFVNKDEAMAWIAKNPCIWMDREWDWDGDDVPAMTEYFSDRELTKLQLTRLS